MQQQPTYTQPLRYHRLLPIILVFIALVLVVVFVYDNHTREVQAAGTGYTQTQAYSTNFTTRNLPTDGVTQKTLMKIPFAVPSNGKVEVTSIFSLVIFNPLRRVQSCLGCNAGTLHCSLVLDGAPISSLSDVYYSYNTVSQEYSLTTTSAVIAGTHTLALLCTGLLNANYTNLVMQATGRGMSAIVLF